MEASIPSASSSKRGVWLIGGMSEIMTDSKLPTTRQVLSRFFYLHRLQKQTIRVSATISAQELLVFWAKARITTRRQQHIITKIEKLHQQWRGLQKNALKRTHSQIKREDAFTSDIDQLFDIAHFNALDLIKIPEDREFLLAQRKKGRYGSFSGVNIKLFGAEKRRDSRTMMVEKRRKSEDEHASKSMQSLEESNVSDDIADIDYTISASLVLSPKKEKVISSDVAPSLDCAQVSDQNATFILASVAQGLGQDPSQLVLKESVRQTRRQNRDI